MTQPTIPHTGFLRLPEVLKIFPVSKSTWWAGVKSGIYPRPVKLSVNITAWKAEDIGALVRSYNG
ncbi:MAG: AlpA family phage regulatory protein [Alphaproteobacteria bacterium]|nr:AlpA family phage regulatory protein [Alphaproteobacteria bacterium]